MARSTVFRFKNSANDPQTIGKDLNVGSVLMGRVTQHGDTVAVQADLVNTADGSEMWGKHYERKMADVTQVQSDITRDVAKKLQVDTAGNAPATWATPAPRIPTPIASTSKRSSTLYGRTRPGILKSVDLFRQAVAADPNYALAWAGLANSYVVAAGYGRLIPPEQSLSLADQASQKAVALDDSSSEAHVARANALGTAWKWSEAEPEFRRAIDLNPNNSNAHYFYAFNYLMPTNHLDQALEQFRLALALDPLASIVKTNYALTLMDAHRVPRSPRAVRSNPRARSHFRPGAFLSIPISGYPRPVGRRGEHAAEIRPGRGYRRAFVEPRRERLRRFHGRCRRRHASSERRRRIRAGRRS